MSGVDGAAARRRDRRLRQFLRQEQLSVKMHVAAVLHHSAQRGARVDAATNSATNVVAATQTMTYAAPALVVEYVVLAPTPAVHAALARTDEYVAPAPVITHLACLLEPPVLVVQVVQVPQVQMIAKQLRLENLFLVKTPKLARV